MTIATQAKLVQEGSVFKIIDNTGKTICSSSKRGHVIDRVIFRDTNNTIKAGIDELFNESGELVAKYGDESYRTTAHAAKLSAARSPSMVAPSAQKQIVEATKSNFSIMQRFEFLEALTDMVIAETSPSLIVTGSGGLGKSYTIGQRLKSAEMVSYEESLDKVREENVFDMQATIEEIMEENSELTKKEAQQRALLKEAEHEEDLLELAITECDYVIIKGNSTARGLYQSLFEFNGKLVIYDDCDKVLEDDTAVNTLKGALDSSDERVISWNSSAKRGSLPRRFKFTGQVIFVTNKSQHQIDQAIKSRSLRVDLSMTTDEIIERMEMILPKLDMPYDMEVRKDALELCKELKEEATDLNMRTLISICKIRASVPADQWKELAEYTITA